MSGGSVVRSVTGVAGVLLVSRLLGFFREVVIADRFGTSAEYDLYLVAIMFCALAYGIFNYAGYYLFVPYISRKTALAEQEGSPRNRDFWPLLNTGIVAAVVILAGIVLLSPYVLRFWAENHVADDFALMVFYSRVTAVAVLLGVGESFSRAYLNVKKIYTYPAAGFIIYNLFAIGAILLFSDEFGVGAVALGWIGGLLVQNIYLGLRVMGIEPFGRFHLRMITPETKYLITTAGVLIVIEAINRSYFLIDRKFALDFGAGIVSALNYSQVLVQLPDSIIGFGIGAVVFPMFAMRSDAENRERFATLYRRTITAALMLAVPIAGVLFVNAHEIIYLVFQRGAFDPESTQVTTTVIRPFLPSVVALFVVSTSIRACYSGGWVRSVFWGAVFVFAVKALGTWVLADLYGYGGISAATSLAHIGFAGILMMTVLRRASIPGAAGFLLTLLRVLLAGIAAAVVVGYLRTVAPDWWLEHSRNLAIIRLAISGMVIGALYVIFGVMIGLRKEFLSLIRWRQKRAEQPKGEV